MSVYRIVVPSLVILGLLLCGNDAPLEAQSRRGAAHNVQSWSKRTQTKSRIPRRKRTSRKARAQVPSRQATNTAQSGATTPAITKFVAVARPLGARLVIPDIYVDVPVMQGLDDAALMNGPGHDPHSDQPGQPGNCVIAAHRNIWGAEFWHLPNLKKGAAIRLHAPDKTYHYRVVQVLTVPESDFSVLERPRESNLSRLTLYTCTKPRTVSRYVVVADLVSTSPADPNALARPIWLQKPAQPASTNTKTALPIQPTTPTVRPVIDDSASSQESVRTDEVIYIESP